jgi:hypothetical protein
VNPSTRQPIPAVTTQRLPANWAPTVPVIDVGQQLMPWARDEQASRAVTVPIRFVASESAEVWIEAMRR